MQSEASFGHDGLSFLVQSFAHNPFSDLLQMGHQGRAPGRRAWRGVGRSDRLHEKGAGILRAG